MRGRTLAEWTEVFDGTDACVAPVLPLTEAGEHPHLAARATYVDRGTAPSPRRRRGSPGTAATLGHRRPSGPARTPARR